MSPIPTNNRFLDITLAKQEEVRRNLLKGVEREVRNLSLPGDGEMWYVKAVLDTLQNALRKFQEFGWEVVLLDETIFPELVEAIGVLKRGGLEDEIRRILTELLASCNLPTTEEKKGE